MVISSRASGYRLVSALPYKMHGQQTKRCRHQAISSGRATAVRFCHLMR